MRVALALALLAVGPSGRLAAQTFEERLLAVPDTASVRAMSRALTMVWRRRKERWRRRSTWS